LLSMMHKIVSNRRCNHKCN